MIAGDLWLGQGSIQVYVTAVDNEMLPGGVRGLRGREKKHGHRGNLRRQSHAMAQRNLVCDALKLRIGIAQRVEPTAIEGRHDLCGQDGIDADVVRQEFSSPLASKC